MKRKILSCVLALVMVLSSMAGLVTAYAGDAAGADLIQFGSYPQSQVVDRALTRRLSATAKSFKSYSYFSGTGSAYDGLMAAADFMQYSDFTYDGVKYRAVKIDANRPSRTGLAPSGSGTQVVNGYTAGTYYFKYEPLTWRVLDATLGLVVSDKVIDAQPYENLILEVGGQYVAGEGSSVYANDYANSSIRAWLNNEFIATAFNSEEAAKIIESTVTNTGYDEAGAKYAAVDTIDRVFLLSADEAKADYYGFSTEADADDARVAAGTDYASAQGLWTMSGFDGAFWWLRTPGDDSLNAAYVTSTGFIDPQYDVSGTDMGVRPAMYLDNTDHLMHTWDEGEVTLEPTCTEEGEKILTCTVCSQKKTVVIEALGHVEEVTGYVEPTCEEDGRTGDAVCAVCGEELYSDEVIPALGHDWGEWETVIEPTCTESGSELRVCERDSSHVDMRDIDPLGHSDLETRDYADPTCEEDGYTGDEYCGVCGALVNEGEAIPATGHNWSEWTLVSEPTCAEPGIERRYCLTDNTHVETQEITPVGHDWGKWTTVTRPTCEETGLEKRVCKTDPAHEETRVTKAFGHEWGAWTLVKAPTCTEEGLEKRVCSRDENHVETRAVPAKGHKLLIKNIKPATCEEDGYTGDTVCAVCGELLKRGDGLVAKGHTPENGSVAATCATDGMDYVRCTTCGKLLSHKRIAALGHKDENGDGKCDNCNGLIAPNVFTGLRGDADLNGKITAADARIVLRTSAKLRSLDVIPFVLCDLNADGTLSADEARKILRFSAKLEYTL